MIPYDGSSGGDAGRFNRMERCYFCHRKVIEKKIEHLLDNLMAKRETPTEFIQIPVYSLP